MTKKTLPCLLLTASILPAVISLLTACQLTGAETGSIRRPEEDRAVMLPAHKYEPGGSVEVEGRQGVCCEGDYFWVSGSATLAKYDRNWNLISKNEAPFEGYEIVDNMK